MQLKDNLQATLALSGCLFLAACSGSDTDKVSPLIITGALNDTGSTACSDAEEAATTCPQAEFPEQDAEFGRDAQAQNQKLSKTGAGIAGFDWLKLDQNGNPSVVQDSAWNDLGSEHSGARWSCVMDNVTQLMWEVKESDPEHPRAGTNTYTWYDDRVDHNGGVEGAANGGNCSSGTCDTKSYVEMVNRDGLCGHQDWRMPTVEELSSLVVVSKVIPALDTDYFPNAKQPRFFTAQSNAMDPTLAWYVYFSDGSVSSTNKADPSYVRLVRGGQQ